MYENHVLPATAPPVVAMLPSTGGEITVQIAVAVAIGMVVWGLIYKASVKAGVKA